MDDDGLPVISVSPSRCGSVANPHQVRSPMALFCLGCGASLGGILTERLVVALASAAKEASGG